MLVEKSISYVFSTRRNVPIPMHLRNRVFVSHRVLPDRVVNQLMAFCVLCGIIEGR